ncbi:MAG: PD-(D/E)XK nuclease family protein [Bacteroidota bacterium]
MMIGNLPEISFRKLDSVSPSQFTSMKNCSYKTLLAHALKKPLLPVSSNAYFGTVMHKMIELITDGSIPNDEIFDGVFNAEVQKMEVSLKAGGFNSLLPLLGNVKDLAVKKVLLKKYLVNKGGGTNSKPSEVKFLTEQTYKTKDGRIKGKIDLVFENGSFTEIVDFKTGSLSVEMLDDDGEKIFELKDEYKEQLKLYAYLYFETSGKFPTKLSLSGLGLQKQTVSFSEEECGRLATEALGLLDRINTQVETSKFSGNPTHDNCRYCLYRPGCIFYRKAIGELNIGNDLSGVLTDAVKYQNGNVTAVLTVPAGKISITGFPERMLDYFKDNMGKVISIFNLRKSASDTLYAVSKTTMIYE